MCDEFGADVKSCESFAPLPDGDVLIRDFFSPALGRESYERDLALWSAFD
jgi:hypothetical protein